MKRSAAALIIGLGLIAASCATEPAGPLTFSAQADAPSTSGKLLQFSSFYPGTIKARPGDTVVIVNKGPGAPHTVSFGIKADRSNQPPPILPTGDNPAVFENCVTPQEPTNKMTSCPTKTTTPGEYTGSGYWNGFMSPASVPAPAAAKQVTLKLASSINPGEYSFICILHGPMVGKLQVVGDDADRDSITEFNEARDKEVSDAQARAANIPEPPVAGKTPATVAAGWSGGPVAVNEFFPKEISVKAGSQVSFEAFSPFEPHTVTFGGPKSGVVEQQPQLLSPSGVKSGGAYTSGVTNSGIYGVKGGPVFPPGPFVLSFPNAGTYKYTCVLHPGMEGTVKVT